MPLGAEPVNPGSQRLVLEPLGVAVVRAGVPGQAGLPPTVTLGGPAGQSEQLLLRFPEAWLGLDVVAAFLLLLPAPDAEPTAEDVGLDVALSSGTWTSGTVSEPPSSRAPSSAGVGRTRPPAAVRVDVTAFFRELSKHPGNDRGLVVRATGASRRGAVYSTGADGFAPRLDLYFRPHASTR